MRLLNDIHNYNGTNYCVHKCFTSKYSIRLFHGHYNVVVLNIVRQTTGQMDMGKGMLSS